MGVERILELLKDAGQAPEADGCDIYVVHQGEPARVRAFIAAERLRDAGFDVILHCSPDGAGASFKSQMKRADASGAAYAVIIGDDEMASDTASVKALRTQEGADAAEAGQQQVPFDALADHLIDRMTA